MNLFLLHPNHHIGASMLAKRDPIRARKQLLEGCQILATVDHLLHGKTFMMRADGAPYGAAHPHHPIVKNACVSPNQWWLAHDLVKALARCFKDHACSKSFAAWAHPQRSPAKVDAGLLVCCRSGREPCYVTTRTEYSSTMLAYMKETKW